MHHSTCPSCPKRLGRVASSVGWSYGRSVAWSVGLLGRLVGMVGNVGNWTPDADKSLACRPLLAIAGDGWNKALATSASAFCMPTSSSTSWRDVKLDQNHAISWSPPRQSPVTSRQLSSELLVTDLIAPIPALIVHTRAPERHTLHTTHYTLHTAHTAHNSGDLAHDLHGVSTLRGPPR